MAFVCFVNCYYVLYLQMHSVSLWEDRTQEVGFVTKLY